MGMLRTLCLLYQSGLLKCLFIGLLLLQKRLLLHITLLLCQLLLIELLLSKLLLIGLLLKHGSLLLCQLLLRRRRTESNHVALYPALTRICFLRQKCHVALVYRRYHDRLACSQRKTTSIIVGLKCIRFCRQIYTHYFARKKNELFFFEKRKFEIDFFFSVFTLSQRALLADAQRGGTMKKVSMILLIALACFFFALWSLNSSQQKQEAKHTAIVETRRHKEPMGIEEHEEEQATEKEEEKEKQLRSQRVRIKKLSKGELDKRKSLLTLSVGRQHAKTLPSLIKRFSARQFDVFLFSYDSSVAVATWQRMAKYLPHNVTVIRDDGKAKLEFARIYLTDEYVERYAYVFLWDGDAEPTLDFSGSEYVRLAAAHNVDISQPTLAIGSAHSYTFNIEALSHAEFRPHWFVEVGFMVFRADVYQQIWRDVLRWPFKYYCFDSLPFSCMYANVKVGVVGLPVLHPPAQKTLDLNADDAFWASMTEFDRYEMIINCADCCQFVLDQVATSLCLRHDSSRSCWKPTHRQSLCRNYQLGTS
jgi:Protein of unknown function (DUF707)